MSVRRTILLAVVLYLSADYCDPSIPGVFSFGTESFFVESVDSRSGARPVLPVNIATLRARDTITPLRALAPIPTHARTEHRPYAPRAQILIGPPATPAADEDH